MTEHTSTNKQKLNVKDLITVGIFSALLSFAMLIGGTPLAINPITTFYASIGFALLGGPIFMLMLAKVPKRGVITISGILMGFLLFVTGMHWGFYLGCIIGGICAEGIASLGKFRNKKVNAFAYAILCSGGILVFVVYFIDPAAWSANMLKKGADQGYLDAMASAASPSILIIIFIATILVALFSAWFGTVLLKKQFEKAGITA